MGMASALDTLFGQAFGAGQIEKLGIYMRYSLIVHTILAFLMSPLYVFATPILKFLGQDDKIAALAGVFAIRILPTLFTMVINLTTQKFLQAQSKVAVLAWIGFGGLVIQIGTLWLFTHVFSWGLKGAALAVDVTAGVRCLAQLAYVLLCSDHAIILLKLSLPTFEETRAYMKLALASTIMYCLEGWNQIALLIVTGLLPNPEITVASFSICYNIKTMVGMLLGGLGAAICVRVSNELGSCRPRAAKYSIAIVGILSVLLGLTCVSIIIAARDYLPVFFTSDKELQGAVLKLLPLLSITVLLGSIQPIITGAFVGGGWQYVVAHIDSGCYLLGFFLQFILGFKLHLGLQGTWGGMLCGVFLQNLILWGIIWKFNWKKEAIKASERLQLRSSQDEITVTSLQT